MQRWISHPPTTLAVKNRTTPHCSSLPASITDVGRTHIQGSSFKPNGVHAFHLSRDLAGSPQYRLPLCMHMG